MTLHVILLIALVAFVSAAILPGLLQPLLAKAGVLDIPNERSSHGSPAIRGIGLAPAGSFIAALLVILTLAPPKYQLVLVGSLVMVLGASVIGWTEDVRGIAAKYRVIFQSVVGFSGVALIVAGLEQAIWWIPLGILVVVAYINVANFMDGINGISGSHGALVGVHYVVLGLTFDMKPLTIIGVLLATVFIAFLPWNLIHGKMFLGDVGSYLLGSTIAAVSVIALVGGIHPVAVLGPVAIYLTDTGVTLLRRIRERERWMDAHRSHVYQRLASHGYSHWRVSLIVSAFGLATGFAGLLAVLNSSSGWLLGLPLIVLLCATYVVLPNWLSQRAGEIGDIQGSVG